MNRKIDNAMVKAKSTKIQTVNYKQSTTQCVGSCYSTSGNRRDISDQVQILTHCSVETLLTSCLTTITPNVLRKNMIDTDR